jgi:hypothetical protein
LAAVMLVPGLSLTPAADDSTPVAAIDAPLSDSLAERLPSVLFAETFVPPPSFGAVEVPVGGDWPSEEAPAFLEAAPSPPWAVPVVWTIMERILVPAVGSVWQQTVVLTSSDGRVEWIQTTTAVWTLPSQALSPTFPGIDRRAL